MRVLAFDIGIRNLAWCILEKTSADTWIIHGWENYDLLAGTSTQEAKNAAKVLCTCGKNAQYRVVSTGQAACAKHCPTTHPPLRDLSGALLKTLPKLEALRAILDGLKPNIRKPKGKAQVLEALAERVSLPLEKVKATRGKQEDLVAIHKSIHNFVRMNCGKFFQTDHILLENQPAFKNPTMKSVQILLFATLRDFILRDLLEGQPEPAVAFVHAGKKVKGAKTGDEGYTARKKGGEDRVKDFFEKQTIEKRAEWSAYYGSQQKKSDLCDALCMCLDKITSAA